MKAIQALLEMKFEQEEMGHIGELKEESDKCYEYYKRGGKMISPVEANEQIN